MSITPIIQGTAQCRICNKGFSGPRAMLIATDQSSHVRTQKFLESLVQHIQVEHPPLFQNALISNQEYFGMVILNNFAITDPALDDQRNFFRWKTHQATLKVTIAEEAIELSATAYAEQTLNSIDQDATFDPHIRGKIRAALEINFKECMMTMREQLQEPESYLITDPRAAVQA